MTYVEKGKLYKLTEMGNKGNTGKWPYWKSFYDWKETENDADGHIKAGSFIVFLGVNQNLYKLLLEDGTLAYVPTYGDLAFTCVNPAENPANKK